MADVTRLPGVFEQVRLVAGLRWRILKNGLRRKHNVWDLIGMIWVGVFGTSIVIGLGFAFFAGSYEFFSKNQPAWIGLLYWGLFLWWQVFPIFIAGFGSNFEFAKLLRFPLSLRAFYLLGLGYGLSDFAAISSICWVFCMIAGAAFARIGIVPVMLLVSALFVLINVTLERLVGSWLEKLLAKRRARELFFGIFVLCMVSLNFLNPVFQRWGNGMKPKFIEWIPYLSWLPGSLAGNTIGSAVDFRSPRICDRLCGSSGMGRGDQHLVMAKVCRAICRRRDQRERRAGGDSQKTEKMGGSHGTAWLDIPASGRDGDEGISLPDTQRICFSNPAVASDHGGLLQFPVRAGIGIEAAFTET